MGADLLTILDALRERTLLIVLCVIAALSFGAYYLSRAPKIFRAQAVLQVEQEERNIVIIDGLRGEDLRAQEVLMTIEQNLTSSGLWMQVITKGNLSQDPAFLPEVKRPVSDEVLQSILAKRIRVKVRPGTRLIDVSVEERSSEMAVKLVRLGIEEFMREGFRERTETSKAEHDFMLGEARLLRARLEGSERALQDYREKTQAVSLEEKQNIVVEKLKEMNLRVTEAKTLRLRLETDNATLAKMPRDNPEALLSIVSVANAEPVRELQKGIQMKESEIGTLRKRYKPLHPKYIAAASDLAEMHEKLSEAIIKSANNVAQSYSAAVEIEKRMENALQEQERIALELNRKAIDYSALSSDVQSDRTLYESVLKRLKETDITKKIAQNAIRIASPPMGSDIPVKPNHERTMMLALFGGLALGCGMALVNRSLDRTLRTVDEAENLLEQIPALAVVPIVRRVRSLRDGMPLLKDPGSNVAESFRTLRASLSLLGRKARGRTILFTSAVPGEGKSFCAINTAIAHAQQGLSTLIIDADLRLPSVCSAFFSDKEFPGLSNILADGDAPKEVIRSSGIENLSILCAGTRTGKAAELLARGGMAKVIRWAVENFQCVIIDSAPVHAVSDTLLIVQHVGTICLVVRAGLTPTQTVTGALRKLKKAGAHVDGFVLNGVRRFRTDHYAGYYQGAYETKTLDDASKPIAELPDTKN